MANYYNRTRGPIAVTLSSGKSLSIPPKSWVEIDPSDAGSADLVPLVQRGYLVRSALDSAPVAAPVPAPPPSPPPVKEKEMELSPPAAAEKDKSEGPGKKK